MGRYRSTKTYGTNLGLSCAFRQPGATSHCRFIHGYSLGFKFVFEATALDDNGWVVDFGALKPLKSKLEKLFDHTVCVATYDPEMDRFVKLAEEGIIQIRIVPRVGCESFAEMAYWHAVETTRLIGVNERVEVISAECMEHGANSAVYSGGDRF